MVKTLMITAVLLLLCSSCVSRTTIKEPGLNGKETGNSETRLIWFWDKDF